MPRFQAKIQVYNSSEMDFGQLEQPKCAGAGVRGRLRSIGALELLIMVMVNCFSEMNYCRPRAQLYCTMSIAAAMGL
jgi:hypothetical protein